MFQPLRHLLGFLSNPGKRSHLRCELSGQTPQARLRLLLHLGGTAWHDHEPLQPASQKRAQWLGVGTAGFLLRWHRGLGCSLLGRLAARQSVLLSAWKAAYGCFLSNRQCQSHSLECIHREKGLFVPNGFRSRVLWSRFRHWCRVCVSPCPGAAISLFPLSQGQCLNHLNLCLVLTSWPCSLLIAYFHPYEHYLTHSDISMRMLTCS